MKNAKKRRYLNNISILNSHEDLICNVLNQACSSFHAGSLEIKSKVPLMWKRTYGKCFANIKVCITGPINGPAIQAEITWVLVHKVNHQINFNGPAIP